MGFALADTVRILSPRIIPSPLQRIHPEDTMKLLTKELRKKLSYVLDFGMFSRPPRSDDTNGRRHLR